MIDKIIMWLCHIRYKKYGMPIFYIKGLKKDYPKYLIYTEDEKVYQRMDRFWATGKRGRGMTEYRFENDALYRYTPVNPGNAEIAKKELVITKDEFLMCYIKWICSESKAKREK